jgi:RNA polymerase sporulation-specific sigma factor
MDYNEYSDSELFSLICEEDDNAKDVLFEKYKYIIDIVIKKYAFAAMKYGFEYKDLYQEALVGFADAMNSYKDDKNSSMATFITLCVDRRLQNVIRKSSRIKNRILLETLSLDHVYEQYEVPLKDVISDNSLHDPLHNIMKDEDFDDLVLKIEKSLSPSEREVYKLILSGLNYNEIAKTLNKSTKQIDNAMQRIKTKVKDILKLRESA